MGASSKVAIVTGAGSGIGRAVAVRWAQAGFAVVLAGRREDRLQETAANVATAETKVVPTDVTDPESVARLFQTAKEGYGRLDLIFNNAGINVEAKPIEELTFEQWKSVIDVNLNGLFLCTQYAIRLMKDQNPQGGRIINNGSISSEVPRPNSSPYTASKHAVRGLTKSTSLEGRVHNIACGQIDIGNADTDMVAGTKKGTLQANREIAVEPTMPVDCVAEAAYYMASLPLDANVLFMTVMASQMPFVGRG